MKLKLISIIFLSFLPCFLFAQHDHHTDDATTNHNHLAHMQVSRAQTFYIHNLPPPELMTGIGNSTMTIQTSSEKTQAYFNQGLSLLHDFWDFEAYRAFKEAIRNDSSAVMPYWGLLQTIGLDDDSVYKSNRSISLEKLKNLSETANEHEKLYAEISLLTDSLKDKAYLEVNKKYELIIHKFPDDINAKLFFALSLMTGFDTEMKPKEGQMYSEFLLKDVQHTEPNNHALHHYWIHLKEQCCPEEALNSADLLTSLAPNSGHIVHMPGHIYNRVGNYKKAHDAFVASVKTDSAYMINEGIEEVDNWNYIHNINYLINNCVHDGRLSEALYYAERLKYMPVNKYRKKIYDGTFFNQGILAPAKMEMAFGRWDKAVTQLGKVVNNDTAFSYTNMEFKNGLTFFAKGMDALVKNNVSEAIQYSNNLDALLWRNEKQSGMDSIIIQGYQNTLNTASLELQGCIASYQGNFDQAMMLLERAQKNELELGYGEPPLYARPVAVSIADAFIKEKNYDMAIETYMDLLKRFPKSAYIYFHLLKIYKETGEEDKIIEYTNLFNEAALYADKGIYEDY
jgi:tetratricopeptide (TPR) repeat protein